MASPWRTWLAHPATPSSPAGCTHWSTSAPSDGPPPGPADREPGSPPLRSMAGRSEPPPADLPRGPHLGPGLVRLRLARPSPPHGLDHMPRPFLTFAPFA